VTDLYQKGVLRHAAAARRSGRLNDAHGSATLDNPLCGDRVTIDVKVKDGTVRDISQDVKACVLCQACASILCENAIGADRETLEDVRAQVTAMLKGGGAAPQDGWDALKVFAPVADHKSRHACVLLPFEAAEQALDDASQD
jgi:SUF system NifU family Fe-S assembly protein